jgi:hypothetical protein
MRSGDILLARYQLIDRSINPHGQQRNVMQLSVCEEKRLRLNGTKRRGNKGSGHGRKTEHRKESCIEMKGQ